MHTFRAMNTDFVTSGLPDRAKAKAVSWFAFVERNLSRFLPQSELSALNRSAGRPFLASALLYQALSEADRYYHKTGGLFNPYLGRILNNLGYSGSFETLSDQREVRRQEGLLKTPLTGPLAQLNPAMKSVQLLPEASVDLGGIAKGWSAHQLAQMLQRDGIRTGAINAGGDISLWGAPPEGFEIGVADPYHPGEDLLTLQIRGSAGIATSSTIKRRWKDDSGNEHNHIIDPRSGRSGASDLAQVTMLAPDLTAAEVYAKCVLILGSRSGIDWLEEVCPGYAAIGVLKDGSLIFGGDLSQYCKEGELRYERIS
ncbi:FAD:protein FMN transferase [Paenibacillus sp. sptzw28]|uniref:FAD:protein FMN transferase n=1 Tax=Paenibacillus sp. sptzw28 TaxID=715179 RepID=UPI001C6EBBC4|nr:FAD:protein FMN transferase [Paenibacillus sp. sptzw28]QYR21281.1 FAD:protein FMN transferase [Paenibacillus sp. sptzw28]